MGVGFQNSPSPSMRMTRLGCHFWERLSSENCPVAHGNLSSTHVVTTWQPYGAQDLVALETDQIYGLPKLEFSKWSNGFRNS